MTPEAYERASDVFGQATELPAEERVAYVKRTCATEPHIRDEVLSLLKHDIEVEVDLEPRAVPRETSTEDFRASKIGRKKPRRRIGAFVAGSVFAACTFAVIGVIVYFQVNRIQKIELEDKLSTVLDADAEAVRLWLEFIIDTSERWAGHSGMAERAQKAVALKRQGLGILEILQSDENQKFLDLLSPAIDLAALRGVHLLIPEEGLMASTPVGGVFQNPKSKSQDSGRLTRVMSGETVFSPPYMEHSKVENITAKERVPIVSVAAPVIGVSGEPFAVLLFRWRVDEEFSRLLSIARLGDSGETYAFDSTGLVVSSLRQEQLLREIGVIASDAPKGTSLNVMLRDPGEDLTKAQPDETPREVLPLTRMAARATAGFSGINIEGYRDYTGREVVGGWTWLDEYGIGIAAEISYDEAYHAPHTVRGIFVGLIVVLAALGAAGIAHRSIALRLRSELESVREVGPYEIEEVLAEGGMGTVYLARHRLLKRPVAIKVIREDRVGPKAIERFEWEVAAMSKLSHPHTVQILDFGVQPDGALYFAMEYLKGISLHELLKQEGRLPWTRAVHLLKQICGSLAEAHWSGLIHCDIKPQNIMVCSFGNEGDFVKVLDFGLVRNLADNDISTDSTLDRKFAGTPLYMAPECMRDPKSAGPLSDIYSLGALAFHMLVGEAAYCGVNALDTCYRAMTEPLPEIPSAANVPVALSDLIKRMLVVDPSDRPSTIADVLEALNALPATES
jgi:hypothetical protein